MTTINIIRQSAAVHILTDGAACRADGTLAHKVGKVFPLVHLNAAVASRGSPLFAPGFAFRASAATGFDNLKALAVEIALETFTVSKDAMAAAGMPEFDLFVAGWSESRGPDSYFIANHEGHGAAVRPWQIVELGPISLAPSDEAINAELQKLFPDGVHPDRFDVLADGLRVMGIQRVHPVAHLEGTTRPAVGAFAQLTSITPDVIITKIIRRWPDEIGRLLAAGGARV